MPDIFTVFVLAVLFAIAIVTFLYFFIGIPIAAKDAWGHDRLISVMLWIAWSIVTIGVALGILTMFV